MNLDHGLGTNAAAAYSSQKFLSSVPHTQVCTVFYCSLWPTHTQVCTVFYCLAMWGGGA